MNAPRVTIAIPTRNRAGLLAEALNSALAQDYSNLEVLVSDNASTDGTPALLAGYSDPRLRVVRRPENLGMVGNWNACLSEAEGEYFTLLSDDDSLAPGFVSAMVGAFQARPALVFAYCAVEPLGFNMICEYPTPPALEDGPELVQQWLAGRRIIYLCSILFRTERLRGISGFSNGFTYATDAAAWLRLAFDGPVAFIARPLARYRYHPQSLTRSTPVDTIMDEETRLIALVTDEARRRKTSGWVTKQIERLSRRRLARVAAWVLLARAESGSSKRILSGQAWQRRALLRRDVRVALPMALTALLLPGAAIRRLRGLSRWGRSGCPARRPGAES